MLVDIEDVVVFLVIGILLSSIVGIDVLGECNIPLGVKLIVLEDVNLKRS